MLVRKRIEKSITEQAQEEAIFKWLLKRDMEPDEKNFELLLRKTFLKEKYLGKLRYIVFFSQLVYTQKI